MVKKEAVHSSYVIYLYPSVVVECCIRDLITWYSEQYMHGLIVKCVMIIRRGHRFLAIIPQATFAELGALITNILEAFARAAASEYISD